MNILLKLALTFTFGGLVFSGGVKADELKMNAVTFCPETPFELWYPTSKTGMFLDGKMNITKDTLTFDTHGEFKYVVHTTSDDFTYLELDRVSNLNGKMHKFIYLRYDKISDTHRNQSCLLQVHDCTTREGIEVVIREENKPPFNHEIEAYCGSGPYLRNVDQKK